MLVTLHLNVREESASEKLRRRFVANYLPSVFCPPTSLPLATLFTALLTLCPMACLVSERGSVFRSLESLQFII